jgi:hypothetical protein
MFVELYNGAPDIKFSGFSVMGGLSTITTYQIIFCMMQRF